MNTNTAERLFFVKAEGLHKGNGTDSSPSATAITKSQRNKEERGGLQQRLNLFILEQI